MKFYNGYGGFSDDGKEYIISNHPTPAPWCNVISNPNFGTLVTESGGGFTWVGNSRECKLTEWNNDPILDYKSEVITISSGEFSFNPMDKARVHHGFGYTTFIKDNDEVLSTCTVFVPLKGTKKLVVIDITNHSNTTRTFDISYNITPVMGVNHKQNARHLSYSLLDNMAVYTNNYNPEFWDKLMYITPHKSVEIPKDESRSIVLELGIADKTEDITLSTITQASNELSKVKDFWNDATTKNNFKTGDDYIDNMLPWLVYQVISCRLYARTGFYQCGGAYGFRDQLQDCAAVCDIIPHYARQHILRCCRHQFTEGDVQHWWHPSLTDRDVDNGVRTKFTDDRLWLVYATCEYIKKTGDITILDEGEPYIQDSPLAQGEYERYNTPHLSDEKSTVFEHCKRAIDATLNFGEHGLPLIGSGDWNDGFSSIGLGGKGESVWLGFFLHYCIEQFLPYCNKQHLGVEESKVVAGYQAIMDKLKISLNTNAWDGEWFLRAFFDNGTPLGSHNNDECKIDAISQSWAVISGVGDNDKCHKAIESLEKYLVDEDVGIIKLLSPSFDKGNLKPGYIKGYVPGVRENGGQYTHASAWALFAMHKLGKHARARELFKMLMPNYHSIDKENADIYKVEPYVVVADIYSNNMHNGMGGWSWYTGAAGWLYEFARLISEGGAD
ncbi:MAG: hypothetical protein LBM38_03665 [Clostridiales bacterium]|jgi:cellobiose phosphorylase|nr:hypothetical protein [Clostridiales bacterium]